MDKPLSWQTLEFPIPSSLASLSMAKTAMSPSPNRLLYFLMRDSPNSALLTSLSLTSLQFSPPVRVNLPRGVFIHRMLSVHNSLLLLKNCLKGDPSPFLVITDPETPSVSPINLSCSDDFFSFGATNNESSVFLFGGVNFSLGPKADLWKLSLTSLRFKKIIGLGTGPSPRLEPIMNVSGESLLIAGGFASAPLYSSRVLTDAYVFHLKASTWQRVDSGWGARDMTPICADKKGVLLFSRDRKSFGFAEFTYTGGTFSEGKNAMPELIFGPNDAIAEGRDRIWLTRFHITDKKAPDGNFLAVAGVKNSVEVNGTTIIRDLRLVEKGKQVEGKEDWEAQSLEELLTSET